MTPDTVIALAREAGAYWEYNRSHPVPCVFGDDGSLLRFAALVAAAEREQIIRLCGEHWDKAGTVDRIVAAIRSRT